MANSLSPAFVKINYQTRWGRHVMTVPSVAIIPGAGLGDQPDFDLRGAELSVTVGPAVEEYVSALTHQCATTTTFIDYVVYAQATPETIPTPIWSGSLGDPGNNDHHAGAESATMLGDKATQATYTWRTESFGLFKVVLLDVPVYGWNKVTDKAKDQVAGIDGYVTADASWLSGRDGGRPVAFLGLTTTLNEKLRRSYGMT